MNNNNDGQQQFWEQLQMIDIKDQYGVVAASMPFPAGWKLGMNPSITGPHGLKVTDYPLRSFMMNFDPMMQFSYMGTGMQMRAMPGVEQLIQQDFVPWASGQGMALVKFYEIPEVSAIDRWYSGQLYKVGADETYIAAFGIDWKKSDGTPFFTILRLNVSNGGGMQNWYYMAAGLEADAAYFERAKKQYIFALANTRYNMQPIMTYNQQEMQKAGMSWAGHQQRMQQNQANFEASQRAFVNKSEAINDAIMSGWRSSNAASDNMMSSWKAGQAANDISHENYIDSIYERTNVQNMETGQQYKVEAGANNYWMNSNGEYISSNQQNYNPNLDENMNGVKWQELKEFRK